MAFLDWMGRDRGSNRGKDPRVTWISDVYVAHGTWAWAWVHETQAGKFNAGMTVRDPRFNFEKWKTGEGYTKEAEAISFAQRWFKGWRNREPEMTLAKTDIQKVVRNWYRAREMGN